MCTNVTDRRQTTDGRAMTYSERERDIRRCMKQNIWKIFGVYFTVKMHVMWRTVFPRPFCPSVGLSVRRVHCDKTKESCAHSHIPHVRSFVLVFWQEEWLVEGDHFYMKFWAKLTLLERKRRFSIDFARSASAVTPSENSQINTNRKCNTRFPKSLWWTPYAAPKPPRGSKTQNCRFSSKIALQLKKVCYKVFLCESCQW